MEKNNKLINLIPYIFVVLIIIMLYIIGSNFIFIKKDNSKVINIDKIELETQNLNLNYGDNSKINVIYYPSNATNKKLIWSSSNEELVSIDQDGIIKVNKNESGAVIITARTEDGNIEETITLTVLKVDNVISVSGITLNSEEINLKYGESFQLHATISPANATNKNIVWSCNNDLISIDQNGFIKVNKNETNQTIIMAKTSDGEYTATAKVNVTKVENNIKVTGIEVDKKELELKYGESYQLLASIKPHNATNKNITWTSSNTSLVNVTQSGLITVNQNITGQAVVTAITNDGNYKSQTKVNIVKVDTTVKVTGISINKNEINLKYQDTYQLNAKIIPNNATNKNIVWSSSNKDFVSVDQNGIIKVNKDETGTVIITAKTSDGNYIDTATVNVTKIDTTVKVTGVALNKTKETILLNNSSLTTKLQATIYPQNATNQNVIWSSSNPEVATVENGIVTAKKLGRTTITVTTEDGSKTSTATIDVKKNVIIVLGASQVTKMKSYKTEYTSQQNNNYKVSNNTLIYIEKSGSGIDYQTTTGYDTATKKIETIASTQKEFINFYIFFPLVGNTIKNFNCTDIITTNTTIMGYVNNYNDSIKKIIDKGYQTKGYIVSMHPVKVSQSSSYTVVVNENKNSCTKGYRSNRKYYYFNQVIKSLTNQLNSKYVKYIETFTKIMTVTEPDKNYSYKISYNTSDGIHWDEETTKIYVDMMFNLTNDL